MNKVTLLGHLCADPVLETKGDKAYIQFKVAVRRRYRSDGQADADFIQVRAWTFLADFISNHFAKGDMIAICGEIRTDTYEDDKKQRHYSTYVLAEEAYFTANKLNR